MQTMIGKLRCALLVLHAPSDKVAGIGNAADIFAAAKHPKSFVSLGAADHLLTREADARYAGAVIAAWAQPYLEPKRPGWADARDNRVAAHTENGLRTEVRLNGHTLTADEQLSVGDTKLGPDPFF